MRQAAQKPFEHFLHPYVFILKEGNEIQSDFLDYSLLLLQVGQMEILPSPQRHIKVSTPLAQLLKK